MAEAEGAEQVAARAAAGSPRMFWLDGGGARRGSDDGGRRSVIGWLDDDDLSLTYDAHAREVRAHRGGTSEVVGRDVFAVLEELMADDRAHGREATWVGYLGYAARPDLPALVAPPGPARVPDAVWMRARHVREVLEDPTPASPPVPRGAGVAVPPDYTAAFDRVQERLHAGDTYETNLTYRITLPDPTGAVADADPFAAYLRLRRLDPAPYAGFLQHDVPGAGVHLLSASPERYAIVTADRTLETKPIKGTTPRGATPEADAALAEQLAADPKFRAENLMIVDLLRNDVAMVCEVGSVEVPSLMTVESYAAVHQLVSTVRGRLRPEVTTLDALRALFPAGSMTGAPKRRTMEVIAEVERTPRGVYSGAFGWISGDGRADLGVVIRSWVRDAAGTWTLGTGGGITVASDPAEEYAESRWKADRLRRVFEV